MKKRVIIIPVTVLALITPGAVIAAKHLDQSSTAPVIKSSAEDWSKTATVTVATAASFGGSDLDHYEYCINDSESIDDCVWRISTVETVRVRNLGTSFVWLRGVSKYGVVSDVSDYALTRVDRNKPEASAESTVTTTSIAITITATDDSGIKSYEYAIGDTDYVSDGNSHTFSDLSTGTTYTIKVRITDLAGNIKILSLAQSTASPVITRPSRSFSGIKLAGMPNGGFPNGGMLPGRGKKPFEKPAEPERSEESIELEELEKPTEPEQPDEPDNKPEEPDELEEPEKPEELEQQPIEDEEPGCAAESQESETPTESEQPEKPTELTEPEEPEEPTETEQSDEPDNKPEEPDELEEPEKPEELEQSDDGISNDAADDNEPKTENDAVLEEIIPEDYPNGAF